MKKLYSYIFILLYLLALTRPISPYIEYTINKDFISKVLCINKEKPKLQCNGKCHLKKELKKASPDAQKKSNLISIKDYPIGFVNIITTNFKCSAVIELNNEFHSQYSFLYTHQILHPPSA